MKEILTHRGTKKTEMTEQSISKTLHIYLMLSEVEEQGKREYLLDTEVSQSFLPFTSNVNCFQDSFKAIYLKQYACLVWNSLFSSFGGGGSGVAPYNMGASMGYTHHF